MKLTIMFRGREVLHRDKGEQLATKVIDALKDVSDVEQRQVRRKKHHFLRQVTVAKTTRKRVLGRLFRWRSLRVMVGGSHAWKVKDRTGDWRRGSRKTASGKLKRSRALPQPSPFFEIAEKEEEPFTDGNGTLRQMKRT